MLIEARKLVLDRGSMNHCYAATYYTICIILLHYLLTSKNEPAPPVLAREAYAFYTWRLETGAASPQSTTALTITVWPLSIIPT